MTGNLLLPPFRRLLVVAAACSATLSLTNVRADELPWKTNFAEAHASSRISEGHGDRYLGSKRTLGNIEYPGAGRPSQKDVRRLLDEFGWNCEQLGFRTSSDRYPKWSGSG